MALASWLSLDKQSGSGNSNVTASANSDNTGRNARTTNITFSAANCEDVVRAVNQAGKPEFVSFDNATATVAKTGGSVTITGKSNSSKLTFSLGNGDLSLTLPSTYTANSVSANNGEAISGDPGATQEYAFSITFSNIPANATVAALTKQLIVTPNSGTAATCNISQTAGDATLSVSPSSVTLDWDAYTQGDSETFAVTSNTDWTVA